MGARVIKPQLDPFLPAPWPPENAEATLPHTWWELKLPHLYVKRVLRFWLFPSRSSRACGKVGNTPEAGGRSTDLACFPVFHRLFLFASFSFVMTLSEDFPAAGRLRLGREGMDPFPHQSRPESLARLGDQDHSLLRVLHREDRTPSWDPSPCPMARKVR